MPINGTSGNDTLTGTLGDDELVGLDGNDTQVGDAGNDTLDGGPGADRLDGGEGTDTATYASAAGAVTVYLDGLTANTGDAAGDTLISIERIVGSGYADTLVGSVDRDTIEGGAGNDRIEGREGHDVLDGGDGADTVLGGAGDDVIRGGLGNDNLQGEGGNDTLEGGADSDTLSGGSGSDTLLGEAGNDSLDGGSGADRLEGGSGDDSLFGGDGDDTLIGGEGNNVLSGGNGTNMLIAGNGNDSVSGGLGDDVIEAGEGHNSIVDHGGYDSITAGSGNDYIEVMRAVDAWSGEGGGVATVDAGDGNNTIVFEAGTTNITTGNGDDTVDQQLGWYSFFNFGQHTIDVGDGRNTLTLRGGIITALSGSGDDRYNLYGGDTTLSAGSGNDVLTGNGFVSADLGAGDDTASLGVSRVQSLTLGAGRDSVTLTGWDNTNALVITDFVTGAAGDRIDITAVLNNNLIGWDGDANPFGDAGFLRLVQDGTSTLLQVDRDGAAGGAQDFVTLVTFQNTIAANFVRGNILPPYPIGGGALGDTIVGGPGDDPLTGGDDADTLIGNGGDDDISGGDGEDLILGGDGDDTISGGPGGDVIDGGTGSDTATYDPPTSGGVTVDMENPSGGTGDAEGDSFVDVETITATDSDDVLRGDANANTLDGRGGDDTLEGRGGNDTLIGGDGTDIVEFDGNRHDFNISQNDDGTYTVVDVRDGAPLGTDTISGVESLVFNDVTVAPAEALNDLPQAVADSFAGVEDTVTTGNVLGNDTDPDLGDTRSVSNAGTIVTAGGGTVVLQTDGEFTYTPATNWSGTDSFDYTIADAGGLTSSATATIAVAAVNDAPTFGAGEGIVTTDFNAQYDLSYGLAIQHDGRIVVAGYTSDGTGENFAVARYNPDGTLDTTFGVGGRVVVDNPTAPRVALSVAIDGAGRIVLSGSGGDDGPHLTVLRMLSSGAPDPDFSPSAGDGVGIIEIGSGAPYSYGYGTLLMDDKIVVVGTRGGDLVLVRLNADGTLDETFASGGIAVTAVGANNAAAFQAISDPDGNILVAGYATVDGYDRIVVARYTADGRIDNSFGTNGFAYQAMDTLDVRAFSLDIQDDGRIVVTGFTEGRSHDDLMVARFDPDGSPDLTFGINGLASAGIPALEDEGRRVVVQGDGRIVVAGHSWNGNAWEFLVVRLNSDGSPDVTFGGGDGIVTTGIADLDARGFNLHVDGAGRILVSGHVGQGDEYDFALVRYNPDGSPDTTFGAVSTLGGSASYTEGGPAVILDSDVNVTDVELDGLNGGAGDYAGAVLTLARAGGADASDVPGFETTGASFTVAGGELQSAGLTFATFALETGVLTVTFTSSETIATSALVDDVLRHVTYATGSDAPPVSVDIAWTFSDGNAGAQGLAGALEASGVVTVNITPTNDAPVLTGDLAAEVNEGGTVVIGAADLGFVDPDDVAADVTFSISALVNGAVLVDGVAATSFTGQQLADGLVSFQHDGSDTVAASFAVSVKDFFEPTTALLTVAYIDNDPSDGSMGTYDPEIDTLVAGINDANGDGVVSIGDTIILNRYPLDVDATSTGAFLENTLIVTGLLNSSATQIVSLTEGGMFVFNVDMYDERLVIVDIDGNTSRGNVFLMDFISHTIADTVYVDNGLYGANGPGNPDTFVVSEAFRNGDDAFIDIELHHAPLTGVTATFNLVVVSANVAPVLTGDLEASVPRSTSVVLTAADLGATDPDDDPSGVTFTVSNLMHGAVLVAGAASDRFTAQDILDGRVSFQHDSTGVATASFDVIVEDGDEDGSAAQPVTFTLSVDQLYSINDVFHDAMVATQSPNYGGPRFPASNIIDNDVSTFQHTQRDGTVEVDLNGRYIVSSIEIVNRGDFGGFRLDGSVVQLLNDDGEVVYSFNPITGATVGETFELTLPTSMVASAVRIDGPTDEFLHIAELDVHGTAVVNLTDWFGDTMTATQSSALWGGAFPAANVIDGDALTFNHTMTGGDLTLAFNGAYDVTSIELLNRAELGWRLDGAVVSLLDADGSVLYSFDPVSDARSGAPLSFELDQVITAYGVSIDQAPGQYLHIAELNVFGVAPDPFMIA